MREQHRCDECVFWKQIKDTLPGIDIGVCRVHAPTLGPDREPVWPRTYPNDWCGAYSPSQAVIDAAFGGG